MNKILVFDMDGTLADFYGCRNWLEDIRSYNPRPYQVARPLYDIAKINALVSHLKLCGWRIVVTSWLAKESTKEYDAQVRQAKREWLARYNFPYDEIHLVKYGTTKANCTRRHGGYQVLVDDNAEVRAGWNLGKTIDARKDFTDELIRLFEIGR